VPTRKLDESPAGSSRGPSSLSKLVEARHIAVFGASSVPSKWGYGVVAGLLKSNFTGKLTLVNPKGGEVCGLPRVTAEKAAGADIAVIATPAASTPDVILQCSDLGIPVAVVVAGGFSETGNTDLTANLATVLKQTGVRLLGPNCLGVFSGRNGINTTSFELPVGTISAIAQSGGFIQHAGLRLGQLGAGFDIVLSLGNKMDVDLTDALRVVTDAGTSSSLIFYLERLDEGERFLDAIAAATSALPMVALVGGKTAAGVRAARSHTDSIIGRWDRATALLEDVGVQVVDSIPAAVSTAIGGQRLGRQTVHRVFALCDGGSAAVLLADALEHAGYSLAQPSDDLAHHLQTKIGLPVRGANPLDMQGRAEADLSTLLNASRSVLESGEYDALVIGGIFGSYGRLLGADLGTTEEQIAVELPAISASTGRPVVIQSMYAAQPSRALDLVRARGVACVEWPEEVVRVIEGRGRGRPSKVLWRGSAVSSAGTGADPALAELVAQVVDALEAAGVPHALGELVVPGAIHPRAPGPWVVRADGFPHKSAADAIKLGVWGPDLEDAVSGLASASWAAGLTPTIRVAPLIEHDHELIVTLWRDPLEGDGFMIGQGGTSVEKRTDVAVGRMPSGVADVSRVIERTAIGQRLLSSEPEGLQKGIELVLGLASAFRSGLAQLRELECNPVAITKDAAFVLDVLPSLRGDSSSYRTSPGASGVERVAALP
jgi:acyl-CoA synthetase (NDP forming)